MHHYNNFQSGVPTPQHLIKGRMVARELVNTSSYLSGNYPFMPGKATKKGNCDVKFRRFQMKTCLPLYLVRHLQHSSACRTLCFVAVCLR